MAYHVIQFKELPYADVDNYVCVPHSWIKWWDESKERVIVAYPVEAKSLTVLRVKNNERYSSNWKCYMAIAEYKTNGYNEAVNFIEYLNNKRNRKLDESVRKSRIIVGEGSSNVQSPGNVKIEENEDNSSSDETVLVEPLLNPTPGKAAEAKREKPQIILPPEYDTNFPRWSLKYPDSNYRGRMDLIELRPGGKKSGVFVDRSGWDKCLEVSDTDNTLARNLLMEIFTESALQVCTLTGKVPAGADDNSERRPGLYVHAVNALVSTVSQHGPNQVFDEIAVRNCLSSKLYHLRSLQTKHCK